MRREDWFRLPLKLRQRWWKETDYGKQPPSDELKEIIDAFEKGLIIEGEAQK